MANLRPVKPCRWLSIALIATLFSCVLLFEAMAVPGHAKKVDPFDSNVTSPVRLALTQTGELLVSDNQTRSVLIVNLSSQKLEKRITVNGRPSGVGAYGQQIYIGNETSRSIDVYSRKGKFLSALGAGSIGLPNDIAIDQTSGLLFVVDAEAGHVRLFNSQGEDAGIIPSPGVTQTLVHPTALTIDQENQLVYVSDQGPSVDSLGFSNRSALVRIYTYSGSYVDTLSGAFTRPQGLTINPDGYLYLADGMRGQVLVYDLNSKSLVKTIGSPGTGPGQLSLPLDVAIHTDSGDLWVTNNRAGRLELFPGGGVSP